MEKASKIQVQPHWCLPTAGCCTGAMWNFLAHHQTWVSPTHFFGMITLQGLLMSGSEHGGGCQNCPAETEAMHPHLAASVFPEESLLPRSPQPRACASHGITMAMGSRRTGHQSSTCANLLLQGFVVFSLPLPRRIGYSLLPGTEMLPFGVQPCG